MAVTKKYSEYFAIDDNYFPQINDSSIEKGEEQDSDFWMHTYPHPTFIKMLECLEKSLSHTVKKSLWIEGAYGAGKSQCAYALRRILEASEPKLREYWSRYDVLSKHTDLLKRLCGHKSRKIVVAYRYSSSDIDSDQKFFMAIQDSVLSALKKSGCSYLGSNTLKDSVVAWLKDIAHQHFFDELLKTKYSSRFSQRSSMEILSTLNREGNVDETMENVRYLAEQEGITSMNLDVDRLCNWIRDVVKTNNIQLVFVWDEFSDYFKLNDAFSGFQKTTELYGEISFFFVPITNHSDAMMSKTLNNSVDWRRLRDRFQSCRIELPDNVALDLIGHGLKVKQERCYDWNEMANDLNAGLSNSRAAVAKVAKIENPDVMKKILPIHPMTAFVLKHLASVFQSNQRSMFDFIKTADPDVKAFQWFIENFGPEDSTPLLTVDMLWNFFYEYNRNFLEPQVRGILDGYEKRQANLRDDQKAVLKATLILQALDEKLKNQVEILHPNDKNLALVFDGVTSLSGSRAGNIASNMVKDHIIFTKPLLDKSMVYAVESSSVDATRLEELKKKVQDNFKTSKVINDGDLKDALALTPPLRLRFEEVSGLGYITPSSEKDFVQKTREIRDRSIESWKFKAIVCFASNTVEGISFRKKIREEANASENDGIVFIDATSTTLQEQDFEDYVSFTANAEYYQKSDSQASREHASKAKQILSNWRDSFKDGRFTIYYNEGTWTKNDLQGLYEVLQEIVKGRYPKSFDFEKGLTESQLKKANSPQSVLCGIYAKDQKTSGTVVGIEKKVFPKNICEEITFNDGKKAQWPVPLYWEVFPDADISQIKIAVESIVNSGFKKNGKVSINEICDMLEANYGFARCNLYSFLTGFLLKEYGNNNALRYMDSYGAQKEMSPEKLSVALGDYLSGKNDAPSYIVMRTSEEKAFYKIAHEAWDAKKDCQSPTEAASAVTSFLHKRGYPLQFIESVVTPDTYKIAQLFIELCKYSGGEQLAVANKIGEIGKTLPNLGLELKSALSSEKFHEGAETYLKEFDGGKLWSLAEEIGADIFVDVKKCFEIKYQNIWSVETQDDVLRKLEIEYEFAKEINAIFNLRAKSKDEALKGIRDVFSRMPVSCETLKEEKSTLTNLLDTFLKICKFEELLPDVLQSTLEEIVALRDKLEELNKDTVALFFMCYRVYLDGINEEELPSLVQKTPSDMFKKSASECRQIVEALANETRRNQHKTQLSKLWRDNTGTANPREWSKQFETPILCLFEDSEYDNAKRTFDTLNISNPNDADVRQAMLYLTQTPTFVLLADESRRCAAFEEKMFKTKAARLFLSYKQVVAELVKKYPEVYDWYPIPPNVEKLINEMVKEASNAGGCQKAHDTVKNVTPEIVKEKLCRIVKENITVALEILASWED